MTQKVREPSSIEIEYITKSLTINNINVTKVIVHSAIELGFSTQYCIEAYHDGQCTMFNACKKQIDSTNLKEKILTNEEVYKLISKIANDCELLYKYSTHIKPFVINSGKFTVVCKNQILFITLTNGDVSDQYYLDLRPTTTAMVISINSGANFSKCDWISTKSFRLAHDVVEYTDRIDEYIDIQCLKNMDNDDYFSFSTVNSLSKENFENLIKIYKVLDSIKYTEYKIKFEDFRISNKNISLYNEAIENYMSVDLEKHILEQIERIYADYIKIP